MDSPGKSLKRTPPQPESLPAPSQNVREKSTLQRLNSVSVKDLNTFLSGAMNSPGKSLKRKTLVQDPINKKPEKKEEEDLNLKKSKVNQAMDSLGKSVEGEIPVQAPINNKPEKEEKGSEE